MTVIHTREGHVPDLSDCPPAKLNRGDPSLRIGDPGPKGRILIRGEYGHDIIDELAPAARRAGHRQAGQGLVLRHRPSGRTWRSRGITSLIVTGVTTEVCVHTTVREANDRGYECLVLSDCVGSYFPEFQRVGLAMIAAQGGIFGWVAPSDAFLAALSPAPNASSRRPTESTHDHAPSEPATARSCSWWIAGRHQRLLRARLQRPGQRAGADAACASGSSSIPGTEVFGVILPGAGHPAADRQRLLHLPRAPPGRARGPRRRHRDALRAERAAHVHRRLRDHAADLPGRPRTRCAAWAAGLAWCFIIGAHRADRRVRRPVHPQVHPAGGDARHAGRHLDRVHLDAAGRADVGGAVDRAAGAGDHPDRLLHRPEAAGQHPGRPRGAAASARRSAGSAGTCPRRT